MRKTDNIKIYDVAIVGAGPAGLTAALYAVRDDKKVILFEKNFEGGQLLNTHSIMNIPGFSEISGGDFAQKIMEQITSFAEPKQLLTIVYDGVENIVKDNNFTITTEDGSEYLSKTVICASGSTYRILDVPGEKELIGNGISFCSTCDAPFYRGKKVVIIGGGNSALTEAIELSKFVKEIIICQNLPFLTATKDLQEKIKTLSKVKTIFNRTVSSFERNKNGILIRLSGAENGVIEADGVFIAIGLAPDNAYAKNIATIDNGGYIEDTIEGAFAAGDCKRNKANQAVIACGDGATAAICACRYIEQMKS